MFNQKAMIELKARVKYKKVGMMKRVGTFGYKKKENLIHCRPHHILLKLRCGSRNLTGTSFLNVVMFLDHKKFNSNCLDST